MKKGHRISLALKLNLVIVSIILVTAIGLTAISYMAHGRQTQQFFFDQTEHAAISALDVIDSDLAIYLWETINTDEFQEVRSEALLASDPRILEDWMDNLLEK